MMSSSSYASYSITMKAHPSAISADSHSFTTISVEVLTSSGRPVEDGTIVEFSTSLGQIQKTARTTSGIARAILRSESSIGTANVTALVAATGTIGQLKVDFLEPGTQFFDESFINISSDVYLGYDPNLHLIESAGGVKIEHRGLIIVAQEAQINVTKNILKAKGKLGGDDISLRIGKNVLLASSLYYNFSSMRGVLVTPADDGSKMVAFRGTDLAVSDLDENEKLPDFQFEPLIEPRFFVKARSIIIRPADELKIKRSEFYVDGVRVLSFPLYVIPMNNRTASENQRLSLGSSGLKLNLPLYYSISPNSTGSLRLKHGDERGWGYYNEQRGWQLDLEQEYNRFGTIEGKFKLDKITTKDWGASWNERRNLSSDTIIDSYVDFPSHNNLYSTFNISRAYNDYIVSMNLRGQKLKGFSDRYSSIAYFQANIKPLIKDAVSYSYSTRVSYDSYLEEKNDRLGSGFALQLYGKPINTGGVSSISTSLQMGHNIGGLDPGTSISANAGYYRNIGLIGQLGLHYTYAHTNSRYDYSSQRISGNLSLYPHYRWFSNLYWTYGLDDSSISAFADFTYFFDNNWKLHLIGTLQDFGFSKYDDIEVVLGKKIGKQEIRLFWSESKNRFRFEFSAIDL
ncbi:MAG: invasin domain 3-containing protein [Armatimonadota bacterium]